jgi:hypothetical protein
MIVDTTAPAQALYGLVPPDVGILKDCVITNPNVIAQFGLDVDVLSVTRITSLLADEAAVLDLITLLEELGFRTAIRE